MKLEILMIGKVQDRAYRLLIEEYFQRCAGRIPVEIVHCRNNEDMVKRVHNRECVTSLDEHGKTMDTDQFVKWLSGMMNKGVNRLTFCLGGAEGLPPAIKKSAHESMAMSEFTLNHQLALLVFAEQLYRGLSILFGEPYHKA